MHEKPILITVADYTTEYKYAKSTNNPACYIYKAPIV